MAHDELTQMKLDMNDMKNDVKNISADVSELKTDLREFIKSAKQEFAGKWTEKVLVTIGSAVGLAIIGAIMTLILK